MSGDREHDARVLREAVDWRAVLHGLSRKPVVCDTALADAVPELGGWRGATPDEAERIVQVVTGAMRDAIPEANS